MQLVRSIYLSDIIDLWPVSRGGVHWSAMAEKVIFIPGNHDEAIREHVDTMFGTILVNHEYIHTAADGHRYLLLHGDEFDQVTRHYLGVAILGDKAYDPLVSLNIYLSWLRHTHEECLDGAIYGPIHWPMIKEVDGMQYFNCGDWFDSCTAIEEHLDGRMELILWTGVTKANFEQPLTT